MVFLANNSFAQIVEEAPKDLPKDSLSLTEKKIEKEEDEIIEDMIIKKKAVKAEKVEYLSQITQYGFKNLFNKYTYTPTQPYSSQVSPFAESYMQDYMRRYGNHLTRMKSWAGPYFMLIDNILVQYGIPKELKYLAVIESNLQVSATSWVGAGGPWQFMPYTAREMGLVVNGNYDERRDYYKSTHAAAKYLLQLYRQMHDWLLVIAAYNGGPGRVYSAMKRSGSRNFWELQYYLPEESRNHVKKFIATHYVMEGSGAVMPGAPDMASTTSVQFFNFEGGFPVSQERTIVSRNASNGTIQKTKTYLSQEETDASVKQTVSGKFKSVVIAKNLAMDISTFNRYNPQFDALLSRNGNYDLTLPTEKMQLFMANKYQILNECVQLMFSDNSVPDSKTVYPKKYSRTYKGR